jgi:predicted phage terminase large subunit-like protein
MDKDELKQYIQNNPNSLVELAGRKRFTNFARNVNPLLKLAPFHKVYYEILDRFAKGEIKRLIISMPPQHGKSEGSSRLLPAYMLGRNPHLKVVVVSFSADFAVGFCRDQQRIIDGTQYPSIFPNTTLNGRNSVTSTRQSKRTQNEYEIVDHRGSGYAVGVGGALTGRKVDVLILDDLYSGPEEGASPVTRSKVQSWYSLVAKSRLHNRSQELIVFTRWNKEDIIGSILSNGISKVVQANKWSDLKNIDDRTWVVINFEAIKDSEPTEFDPRERGEALWESEHSLVNLLEHRAIDPHGFQCVYQGNPASAEGRLYQPFKTWVDKADYGDYQRSGAYIDVADEGKDYLVAVAYDIYKSKGTVYNEITHGQDDLVFALITDMLMTNENTDVTIQTVPALINATKTQSVWVESNSGGAQFEKAIRPKVRALTKPFHQSGNKEARIITSAGMVNACIVFPLGWETRYEKIYNHLTTFLRDFKANTHDDIEDAITGIYEKEITAPVFSGIQNTRQIIPKKR